MRVGELRKEYGREREPFEIHVISMDAYTIDGVRRLEDLGVTDVIVGFRNAYEPDTQAGEGVHLLTGGGGGVMSAVSEAFHGVPERRGLVIGVIPGLRRARPGRPRP